MAELGAPHVWLLLNGDAGHLGAYTYNECAVCGAQGGIALPWKKYQPWFCRYFFADRSFMDLPMEDCDVSLETVKAYKQAEKESNLRQELP